MEDKIGSEVGQKSAFSEVVVDHLGGPSNGNLTVTGSTFTGNTTASALGGGAVYTSGNTGSNTFTFSQEYQGDQVRAMYRGYLGREPERGAVEGWLASGQSLPRIEANILASREFFQKHGNNNADQSCRTARHNHL